MIKNVDLRDDFIGVFETDIQCMQFIEYHKKAEKENTLIRRRNVDMDSDAGARTVKVNDDMTTIDTSMITFNRPAPLLQDYNNMTKACMDIYVSHFNDVANFNLQQAYMNIQRTKPGQGYHVWHYEDGQYGANRRMFATMLYLNDVEEGGETEFLYQHVRFKPKRGTFLIWPAHWTHTHRGNPPLSEEKYIVTSWIENQDI